MRIHESDVQFTHLIPSLNSKRKEKKRKILSNIHTWNNRNQNRGCAMTMCEEKQREIREPINKMTRPPFQITRK